MHFKTWVEATVFVSSSTLRGSLTLSAKKSVYIWVDCFFLQIHSLYVPIWLMAWLFMGERNIIFGHHKHILEMYSLVWIGWNDSMQANFHFDFTANNKKKTVQTVGRKINSMQKYHFVPFVSMEEYQTNHMRRWKPMKKDDSPYAYIWNVWYAFFIIIINMPFLMSQPCVDICYHFWVSLPMANNTNILCKYARSTQHANLPVTSLDEWVTVYWWTRQSSKCVCTDLAESQRLATNNGK